MLATSVFVVLASASVTYAATVTQIMNISDTALVFSAGWTTQFSQNTQSSYKEADGLLCQVAATLPPSTTSVQYIGYQRSGPTSYGYSLDCEADCVLQTFNATDASATDDATAPQATLFTLDVDPSTQHTLRVYNLPTSNDSSPITFDHLSLLVQNNDTASPTGIINPLTSSPTVSSSVALLQATPLTPTSASAGAGSLLPSSGTNTATTDVGSQASASTSSLAVLPSSPSSTADPASSSGSKGSTGVSKNVVIGATILVVVVVVFIIVGLVVFLRQRKKRARNNGRSSLPSPTASIIPIMPPPPPEMRPASLNPFSDPPIGDPFADPFAAQYQVPLDNPAGSSLMQRRMDSRSASPSSAAPTIPLPDLPPAARMNLMQSRSNTPSTVTSVPRTDLWITRTPVKTEFYAV